MDLVELKIFKTVAEQGGITKAAVALHRVQSNVTTRVKQLEARLGTKLFHRQGRKLVLSSEGKVLRGEIEAAFVAEPFPPKNLEMQHAFTEELVLITPKGHARVARPQDIDERIVLAFTTGCSYRRRLEGWLGRSSVVAERVMEYGSYHAIAACVAAGSGIAVVPKSVLRAIGVEAQVAVHPLPASVANAKTMLVWRSGHRSAPLDALRQELR